jgi:redox-sensitive bicupin YhaK (pirin superfamily)
MATIERTMGDQGAIQVVRGDTRGHLDHGWLDTYHTFSFGEYHDPARMGFRSLRVMNEDRIGPGMGFGTHPHRDMEILTYVLEGALFHQDSLGHGGPIRAGEFQRMTAGTGISHGERNASDTEPVHLYQIWLFPDRKGLEPGYEQRAFDERGRQGRWQLVASRDGREGSLTIHQDASISLARPVEGDRLTPEIAADRHGWLQVVRGRVLVGGIALEAGDGATFAGDARPTVEGVAGSEVLLFDLA